MRSPLQRLETIENELDAATSAGAFPALRELHILQAAFDAVLVELSRASRDHPRSHGQHLLPLTSRLELLAGLGVAPDGSLRKRAGRGSNTGTDAGTLVSLAHCWKRLQHCERGALNNSSAQTGDRESESDEDVPISPGPGPGKGRTAYANNSSRQRRSAIERAWRRAVERVAEPPARLAQILAVAAHLFFYAIPFYSALGIYLWLFSPWMWVRVAMTIYAVVIAFKLDVHHPRNKTYWFLRCRIWRWYRDYFPIRLVVPPDVRRWFAEDARRRAPQQRRFLFCVHPHGVHSFAALLNFGTDVNQTSSLFPKVQVHLQTLAAQFYVPFWRELTKLFGLGDASKRTLMQTLTAKPEHDGTVHAAALVPGGAQEALLSSPHTNDLLLGKRKGFIKIALKTGSALVPVFNFGETNVYDNAAEGHPVVSKVLRNIQKMAGFSTPLVFGRGVLSYGWGLMPHRRPIVTVVGTPILVTKVEGEPTQQEVDALHAKYVAALMDLVADHEAVYDWHARRHTRVVQ